MRQYGDGLIWALGCPLGHELKRHSGLWSASGYAPGHKVRERV
jgi:hypothetical protein